MTTKISQRACPLTRKRAYDCTCEYCTRYRESMESATNKKCLNCKKPTQDTLCKECEDNMKKAQESAPKSLFPYLLPKPPAPTPKPSVIVNPPMYSPKPMVLEVRPVCMADRKEDGKRCSKPSQYHFCHLHATQHLQERKELAEKVEELEEQVFNMEANNHSLAKRKAEEIKELKAQLKTAEKCDECDKQTPELLRFCLDCYPTYVKDDLAEDPYLREDVLEPYLKKKDEEIADLKVQIRALVMQREAWLDERIWLWKKYTESEAKLKKHQKKGKGKRELEDLYEGVRGIWDQERKRPKKA